MRFGLIAGAVALMLFGAPASAQETYAQTRAVALYGELINNSTCETALPTAAYRVDWFSVSADDGHALAGSFSFGVRTKAVGAATAVEEGPLDHGGWWRIILRAAFYATLFSWKVDANNPMGYRQIDTGSPRGR